MRSSIAVLSFLAASVAASTLQGRQTSPFPPCAATCIVAADLGGCAAGDTACACKNTNFIESITTCILANCTGDDLTKAIAAGHAICKSVGVTLTSTPVLTGSSATSSAASNTATSTSNKNGNGASAAHLNTLAGISALGLVVLPFL